jgi:glycosyltransferase involved in cell wall biosynthesis
MLNVLWLKKNYPLPVITDFRDDWSQGQSRLDNPPPESFKQYELQLEHQVLAKSDKVIVANEAIKDNFLSIHSDMNPEHFVVITNGYDEKDFQKDFPPRETEKDKLQIVYIGSLYGRRQPAMVWKVLIDLVEQGKINPEKISIHIFGPNYRSFVFKGFENNQILERIVKLHPYLNHSQVPEVMSQADVLWLFIGAGPKSDAISTGKIFEYMRSGKPIWAVINPQGMAANILRPSGLSFIANNENPVDISNSLVNLYNLWQEEKLSVMPDWEYIHSFERRELTRKLAGVFDKTLSKINPDKMNNLE